MPASVDPSQTDGLLTQAAYARHAKVHPMTVHRWIKDGRIALRPDGLLDPEQADRERAASESPFPHHQARKAQIDADKAARELALGHPQGDPAVPASATPEALAEREPMPGIETLGAALKLETYKLQKAKAEHANMELDRMAGTLVERAEVDRVLADFGATTRNILGALPARLAADLARHRGDVAAIEAELHGAVADALEQIATHLQRKLEDAL